MPGMLVMSARHDLHPMIIFMYYIDMMMHPGCCGHLVGPMSTFMWRGHVVRNRSLVGPYHDFYEFLIERGSGQRDQWGANAVVAGDAVCICPEDVHG